MGVRLLRRGGIPAAVWIASWLVLFAGTRACGDDRYGIFVIKADGSEVRKVVQVDGYDYHAAPRWSHDGKRLAFDVRKGPDYSEKHIYLVNVDGSGLRPFADQVNCDWSPDDKQIVLCVYDVPGERGGVYVQNVDGGGRQFLTEGASPRWNADGTKIAFTDWRTLKCIDVASGEIEELLNVELDQYPFHFDWSRDGHRLAFIGRVKGQRRALYIIDLNHLDRPLVRRWGNEFVYFPGFVSWSADGKRLAINAAHYIHILDVEGTGSPRRLPGQSMRSYEPHWSPDGEWIALARRPTWKP